MFFRRSLPFLRPRHQSRLRRWKGIAVVVVKVVIVVVAVVVFVHIPLVFTWNASDFLGTIMLIGSTKSFVA